jgi:hypothetical protein
MTRRVRPGFFARDDMWGPGVSDRRGGNLVPIRKKGGMGRGPFLDPGRNVTGAPFSLFLFFFLFSDFCLNKFANKI